MELGAHVSTSGGLWTVFDRAKELGANTIQFFGASPRQWRTAPLHEDDVNKFLEARKKSSVESIYLHASYLANPASPDEDIWEKTIRNLAAHFIIGEQLGASGLIFHVGSAGKSTPEDGIQRVTQAMKRIIDKVPGEIKLLIENGSSGGNKIGATAEEVGKILKKVNSSRAGVCFDTAHALEAGIITEYNSESIGDLIRDWNEHVGLTSINVIHFNDSKSPAGSHYDRHENLGEGYIGVDGLRLFANKKELYDKAWILEVPGFAGGGPDKENMKILKSFFHEI